MVSSWSNPAPGAVLWEKKPTHRNGVKLWPGRRCITFSCPRDVRTVNNLGGTAGAWGQKAKGIDLTGLDVALWVGTATVAAIMQDSCKAEAQGTGERADALAAVPIRQGT